MSFIEEFNKKADEASALATEAIEALSEARQQMQALSKSALERYPSL